MIGKIISHYKITEKLGEGGMGVVYKAEDTKLKRIIALKFLPPEWTRDPDAKARFMNEAQAASALQHHNVCTIHEIDETEDGRMFICMDYYEGQSLQQLVHTSLIPPQGETKGGVSEARPLPLDDAINYAMQIAEGLNQAHQKTIVHRDLKPANVLVTEEGVAKILDFGLAKLADRTMLTKEGTTLGTVAYMSPEQARGEDVDKRTDIWSLGILLYEMLTGQQPFKGDYEQAVMYSIMNEDPEPVTGLRTGVPLDLERIVDKCLAKKPDHRFQHVDELITDLRRVRKAAAMAPPRPMQAIAKPDLRKWLSSPVVWTFIIVVFGLAGGVLLFYPSKTISFSARDWILITDFENLTGETVFDRSLNTALTVSIQQSNYVNVFPRSRLRETLQRMQKIKLDTLDEVLGSEVALREGIRVVVVPSINRIGEIYSLSAQVVEPNSRVTLKTNTIQAKSQDEILAALDDLAEKIRNDLGESLSAIAKERVPLPRATTPSLQALKSFSEGALAWDSGKYDEAAALWQEAIQKDSSFAWAHASLGGYFYLQNNRPVGEAHFTKVYGLLDRLTEREKLWIQSWIKGWQGDYEGSIKDLNIYLSKYPDDRDAWHNLGNEFRRLKQFNDAVSAYRKALDIDPYMASAFINVATCYNSTQRYSEAIPNYLRAFELQPDWLTSGNLNHEFGFAYVGMGEFKKAEEAFRKMLSGADWQKARGERSLALLDMYVGKYSSAIEHLKEAILYNQTANATLSEVRDRLYLANSYLTQGRGEDVSRQLQAVNRLQKRTYLDPWWLLLAGKLYVRLGRMDKASSILDSLAARVNEANRSDKACLNLLRGEIELARANYDEAVTLFEIAYKLREDNYMLQSLAYGYLVKGDLERASSQYKLLVDKQELGWEAQDCWIKAHYELGKIYELEGDIEQAVKYYERFLEIWREADEDLLDVIDAKARVAKLEGTTIK